jgi:hypothetical protein
MTHLHENPGTFISPELTAQVDANIGLHTVDTRQLLADLNGGDRCGFDQGLTEDRVSLAGALFDVMHGGSIATAVGLHIEDNLFVQERVHAWTNKGGIEQADIVKIKSMHDLTPEGEVFEETLRQLAAEGKLPNGSSDVSQWRVFNNLLRATSIDELPQIIYNVRGASGAPTDNLMNMRLVGSFRPRVACELETQGDNAYADYNKALEIVAKRNGSERMELHWHLGRIAEVGVMSFATGRGARKLRDVQSNVEWIQGALDYERVQKMSPKRKQIAEARIIVMNLRHSITA